jgi:hypothetical protein
VISRMFPALGRRCLADTGADQVHLAREAAVTSDQRCQEPTDGSAVQRCLHTAPQGLRLDLMDAGHCAVLTNSSAVVANLQTGVLLVMHVAREARCVLDENRSCEGVKTRPSSRPWLLLAQRVSVGYS